MPFRYTPNTRSITRRFPVARVSRTARLALLVVKRADASFDGGLSHGLDVVELPGSFCGEVLVDPALCRCVGLAFEARPNCEAFRCLEAEVVERVDDVAVEVCDQVFVVDGPRRDAVLAEV